MKPVEEMDKKSTTETAKIYLEKGHGLLKLCKDLKLPDKIFKNDDEIINTYKLQAGELFYQAALTGDKKAKFAVMNFACWIVFVDSPSKDPFYQSKAKLIYKLLKFSEKEFKEAQYILYHLNKWGNFISEKSPRYFSGFAQNFSSYVNDRTGNTLYAMEYLTLAAARKDARAMADLAHYYVRKFKDPGISEEGQALQDIDFSGVMIYRAALLYEVAGGVLEKEWHNIRQSYVSQYFDDKKEYLRDYSKFHMKMTFTRRSVFERHLRKQSKHFKNIHVLFSHLLKENRGSSKVLITEGFRYLLGIYAEQNLIKALQYFQDALVLNETCYWDLYLCFLMLEESGMIAQDESLKKQRSDFYQTIINKAKTYLNACLNVKEELRYEKYLSYNQVECIVLVAYLYEKGSAGFEFNPSKAIEFYELIKRNSAEITIGDYWHHADGRINNSYSDKSTPLIDYKSTVTYLMESKLFNRGVSSLIADYCYDEVLMPKSQSSCSIM